MIVLPDAVRERMMFALSGATQGEWSTYHADIRRLYAAMLDDALAEIEAAGGRIVFGPPARPRDKTADCVMWVTAAWILVGAALAVILAWHDPSFWS